MTSVRKTIVLEVLDATTAREPALPATFDTSYDPAYDRPADRFAGNLQQEMDNAQPGEIIELDAGVFLPLTLPLK